MLLSKRFILLIFVAFSYLATFAPRRVVRRWTQGGGGSGTRRGTRGHGRRVQDAPELPQARDPPALVWALMGSQGAHGPSVSYQFYLLESIRQARLWNPGVPFYLLMEDTSMLAAHRPAWADLFKQPHFNITIVDVKPLRDWYLIHIEERFRDIWGPLAHDLGARMAPSIAGGTNYQFTLTTLSRLMYLHHWVRATGQRHVVHLENDQMIYGPIQELVDASVACDVHFALGRVAEGRYAASVLYASGMEPLARMMRFLWDTLSHGAYHAAGEIGGNLWVTDMYLTAEFVLRAKRAGWHNYTTWPATTHDGSCLSGALGGATVDGATLGTWATGDFEYTHSFFAVKTPASDLPLWDYPFNWTLVQPSTPVRLPYGPGADALVPKPHVLTLARPSGRPPETGGWDTPLNDVPGWIPAPGGWHDGEDGAWRPDSGQVEQPLPAAAAFVAERGAAVAAGGSNGGDRPWLRVPYWNGTRVWNLHIHSKQLHLWRSDDADVPLLRPPELA